jgi:hypothetical protein
MATSPIRIHGWDDELHRWTATREGEPDFQGVRDLEDAYAAALGRQCELGIPDDVWIAMNDGLSSIRPSDVRRPA